ncbi:uncharacterized protein LOC100747972 [Bombus impatiens]|uniref:Uncharacterized protein LOC100747972 n=1 Tax=Bombus impatiens TaxID=132113 RepID=A0A6P3UWG9_BOMIM|nr:uncharacterized protein LOC100747972 [Bombus impatiens]
MQQPTENCMQEKNFLFERSDLNRQTSRMLFGKWKFGQVKYSNSSTNLFSQTNLFRKQSFENTFDSFVTPPMDKICITTPKAPVKYKKQIKKGGLRPKKLHYTDDELDAIDSGVYIQCNQSNDMFHKQRMAKCNRFDSSQSQIHRLRVKLDKIKVQTNDKENDKNVIGNNKNNVVQESPVVFNPNAKILSQCDNNLNWKEKLYWLQPRRDVGVWIECCRKKCKKWRYVEDYHDPVDVPKIWYCEMNSDKLMASCDIAERPTSCSIKTDLIENAYNAGSIVWAYVKGYPWWPGIINDCPDTCTFYKLPKNSSKPSKYYVTFFNEEKLEANWILKRNLKPLATNKYSTLIKKTKFNGVDYQQLLQKAHETATDALALSILERLRRFSFLALYEKFYDINNNSTQLISNTTRTDILSEMDTNSDDEISCSHPINKHYTLKEYYLEVICKNRNALSNVAK